MQILLHQINKDLLMTGILVNGVSFSQYTILSESMEVVNIVRSKAKISDQALANHTPSLDTTTLSRENILQQPIRMHITGTHRMAADDQHGERRYTVKLSVINKLYCHVAYSNLSDIISFLQVKLGRLTRNTGSRRKNPKLPYKDILNTKVDNSEVTDFTSDLTKRASDVFRI